jgi:Predicted O-methyltransferase
MKTIHIKQKLNDLGIDFDSVVLGDFDSIGEFTAKRQRSRDDANYAKVGAFYRSDYERGILLYFLARCYNLTSFLEIGTGRGYSTLCVAKAFYDAGIKGRIVTVDPKNEEKFVNVLEQVFPKEWLNCVEFVKGTSEEAIPHFKENFDLVYIDGDHSYASTKRDWELVKDKFTHFVVFDDYHLPSKIDAGIQCARAIDEIDHVAIDCKEPELVFLDRRIFFDDRRLPDDAIDYGNVIFEKNNVTGRNDW